MCILLPIFTILPMFSSHVEAKDYGAGDRVPIEVPEGYRGWQMKVTVVFNWEKTIETFWNVKLLAVGVHKNENEFRFVFITGKLWIGGLNRIKIYHLSK